MKSNFAKYLPFVLPSIFSMATLNPKMGVAGQDAMHELSDVLNEIKPADGDAKKTSIVTDEIEEKEVAIQMLAVFIDELGEAYIEYVPQTAQVLLQLTKFTANDSIRTTCVSALPGLIKCIKMKQGNVATQEMFNIAREYNKNIFDAMKEETETECLCSQVSALREIVLECGAGFLSNEEVQEPGTSGLRIIDKSLGRIKELESIKDEEVEDEDDALDEEDLALLKEEGKNEYDLQLCAAELLGSLFKTHKQFVGDLVTTLRTQTLNDAFNSGVQKRLKFGLFVLDDMVEHLGPSYFAPNDYMVIVQTVCKFASNKSAALRQASSYGIGVIAQHGGESFANHSELCLNSLNQAIQFQMTGRVNEKKEKSTQFHHARDNAIASLGKILKYQKALIKSNAAVYNQLIGNWVSLLPITHDTEEGALQYEFLGEVVVQEPDVLFAQDPQGAVSQVAKIFAEAW